MLDFVIMQLTKLLTATTIAVLTGITFARPPSVPGNIPAHSPHSNGKFCLCEEEAQEAADIFQSLIQNYSNKIALQTLTEDFVDYSSSVNIIINHGGDHPMNLTKPTFVGRKAFMDGQGSQPEIPFKQLNLFHGCDSVSLRWLTTRSARGQKTETCDMPVIGNVIIETVKSHPGDKHNFRIKRIFSEFNAAAWLVNLGVFDPKEGVMEEERSLGSNLQRDME